MTQGGGLRVAQRMVDAIGLRKKENLMVQQSTPRPEPDYYTGTVLGKGITLEGALLKGKGEIRIEGSFSGAIDIEGNVVLGETGIIIGEMRATSAQIAGKYEGDLHIMNTLSLLPTAKLFGKIESEKLNIDEGAIIKGTCNVGKVEHLDSFIIERDQAPQKEFAPPPEEA